MKSLKITGLALAGLSFFNLCSAQELIKGSVDGKTISMTMDPFAVNEAIQMGLEAINQNIADIDSLSIASAMVAEYSGGTPMSESFGLANLSSVSGDSVHFFADNLSSLIDGASNDLVGLTSGLYTAELTALIYSTDQPSEEDATYTGSIAIATSGDLGYGGPNLDMYTRLAEFTFGPDSSLYIRQTSLLFITDSSAIAPLLISGDFDNDVSLDPSTGTPDVQIGSCLLRVVRLGDLPEPENIFSVEQGATDPD